MNKLFNESGWLYLITGLILYVIAFSAINVLELVVIFSLVPFLLYSSISKSRFWWIMLCSIFALANLINLLWLSATVTIMQYISFAILLSFLQTIPFIVFKKIDKQSAIAFISSWLVIEYFLLHSEINYPMSLLGLPLASYPQLIQWWEFTGILGGSFWILTLNTIGYQFQITKKRKYIRYFSTLLFFPVVISIIYFLHHSKANEIQLNDNYCVLRTDLPCEEVKYNIEPLKLTRLLVNKTIELSKDKGSNRNVIIFPETALPIPKYSNKICDIDCKILNDANIINENSVVISGGFMKKSLAVTKLTNDTPNTFQNSNFIREKYQLFNTIYLFSENMQDFRVKEKLVPFNEFIPYKKLLSKISPFAYNGPYEFSTNRNIKNFYIYGVKVAPIICYELFNGDFVRNFFNRSIHKHSLLVVGLNEGWYNSHRGFKLAQKHAIARAIENRKSVLKSSNCGSSSYITSVGLTEIEDFDDGFCVKPRVNSETTFYQTWGDYIGFLAIISIFIISVVNFVKKITNANK